MRVLRYLAGTLFLGLIELAVIGLPLASATSLFSFYGHWFHGRAAYGGDTL